jgi:hypothetical protein
MHDKVLVLQYTGECHVNYCMLRIPTHTTDCHKSSVAATEIWHQKFCHVRNCPLVYTEFPRSVRRCLWDRISDCCWQGSIQWGGGAGGKLAPPNAPTSPQKNIWASPPPGLYLQNIVLAVAAVTLVVQLTPAEYVHCGSSSMLAGTCWSFKSLCHDRAVFISYILMRLGVVWSNCRWFFSCLCHTPGDRVVGGGKWEY